MPLETSDSVIQPASLLVPLARPLDTAAVADEVLSCFDRFRDPLLRYVCGFGIPVADAEDLVQEVFLALFRHLQRGGSRENVPGWLFRVGHNLALKQRTRQQRMLAYTRSLSFAGALADQVSDAERNLISAERRLRSAAVLRALPVRDRHCMHLYAEGLRYRDIARVLGISLGAVSKSLARAVARLQRAHER
jgi:RNA polymerase sigma-70 factor (ECF subfamily)